MSYDELRVSYGFAGFFARAESPVLEDALATWASCRGRTITEPFEGIGVAVPEQALTHGKPRNVGSQARELAHRLAEELVAWSRRHPATRFVFVRAESFGVPVRGLRLPERGDPRAGRGSRSGPWRLPRAPAHPTDAPHTLKRNGFSVHPRRQPRESPQALSAP
jgi:hypothetical protein